MFGVEKSEFKDFSFQLVRMKRPKRSCLRVRGTGLRVVKCSGLVFLEQN